MRVDKMTAAELWTRFKTGVNHHNETNMYSRAKKCNQFYEGDQWHGIGLSDELPTMNFITPTVDFKSTMVSKQAIQIVYTPQEVGADPNTDTVCTALNTYARRHWEALNMDALTWAVVKAACISGDHYVYFYDRNLHCQLIDNTSIYFADEQQSDIQKQRYIMIYERRPVEDVKAEAKANGLKKEEIEDILSDEQNELVVGDTSEVKGYQTDGKCGCVLYLYKNDEDGCIHTIRTTQKVIYEPDRAINGMTYYPIAGYVWKRSKNSARGIGEVWKLIPNQVEYNKILVRRSESVKMCAFAKPVYIRNLVENPEDIAAAGKAIEMKGSSVARVKDAFDYIAPAPMSQEAGILASELLTNTRNLAGAGESALGEVNPERASGAAIIAVKDQSALPLNEQMAAFKKFVEDVALIWLDMARAYNPNVFTVRSSAENGLVRVDEIDGGFFTNLRLSVRIDASPTNPFSKYAREVALENAMNTNRITFEEYVDALPEDSTAPKSALSEILKKRQATSPGNAQMAQALNPGEASLSPAQSAAKAPVELTPTLGGSKSI